MNKPLGVFSVETAAEIHRRVMGSSSTQKPTEGQKQRMLPATDYFVKLLEPLAPASNPETGYSQADARIMRYTQPVNPNNLNLEASGDDDSTKLIITNRSLTYYAEPNDIILVRRIGSEYAPLIAAGGTFATSTDCPCDCIEEGDLLLRDEMVPLKYVVKLPDLAFKTEYGTVYLPAGSYTLTWNNTRGMWVLDIGNRLIVYDNAGKDITGSFLLDGEITLTYPQTGDPQLKVCVEIDPSTDDGIIYYPQGYGAGFDYGTENGYIDAIANNPYDDRVVFSGPTGTSGGTGILQQFGTGTLLAPGTGTYGEQTGTGTGTGTFMWSWYEEGFYQGYKDGYRNGWDHGKDLIQAPGTGLGTGTGSMMVGGD